VFTTLVVVFEYSERWPPDTNEKNGVVVKITKNCKRLKKHRSIATTKSGGERARETGEGKRRAGVEEKQCVRAVLEATGVRRGGRDDAGSEPDATFASSANIPPQGMFRGNAAAGVGELRRFLLARTRAMALGPRPAVDGGGRSV